MVQTISGVVSLVLLLELLLFGIIIMEIHSVLDMVIFSIHFSTPISQILDFGEINSLILS